jgi:hypothetical protein
MTGVWLLMLLQRLIESKSVIKKPYNILAFHLLKINDLFLSLLLGISDSIFQHQRENISHWAAKKWREKKDQ